MHVTPKIRAWLLGSALISTLVASFTPSDSAPPETVRPLVKPRVTANDAESKEQIGEIPTITITRRSNANVTADLFNPPNPPATSLPVVDTLPPLPPVQLPYAYQGLLNDRGQFVVLLARDERNHTARVGDILDGDWQIEAISTATVDFAHLPTHTRHTLAIGRAS